MGWSIVRYMRPQVEGELILARRGGRRGSRRRRRRRGIDTTRKTTMRDGKKKKFFPFIKPAYPDFGFLRGYFSIFFFSVAFGGGGSLEEFIMHLGHSIIIILLLHHTTVFGMAGGERGKVANLVGGARHPESTFIRTASQSLCSGFISGPLSPHHDLCPKASLGGASNYPSSRGDLPQPRTHPTFRMEPYTGCQGGPIFQFGNRVDS